MTSTHATPAPALDRQASIAPSWSATGARGFAVIAPAKNDCSQGHAVCLRLFYQDPPPQKRRRRRDMPFV